MWARAGSWRSSASSPRRSAPRSSADRHTGSGGGWVTGDSLEQLTEPELHLVDSAVHDKHIHTFEGRDLLHAPPGPEAQQEHPELSRVRLGPQHLEALRQVRDRPGLLPNLALA